MRYFLAAVLAVLLAGCSTPQAPNPLPPPTKVNLKPVKDRVVVIDRTNKDIGARLDAAIVAAYDARQELKKEQLDRKRIQEDVDSINASLAEAKSKQQEQEGYIMALKLEANAASDQADTAFIASTEAVTRANTAEGKVYKYELQEKEDKRYWGLSGVWRWTKHLGWRIIFLLVGLAIVGFLLNTFVPMAVPVMSVITKFFAGVMLQLWNLIKKLNPFKSKPPS